MTRLPHHPDSDEHKGAVEQETPQASPGEHNLQGQLGHRNYDPMIKDNDTDFPGPEAHEEHTGEHK